MKKSLAILSLVTMAFAASVAVAADGAEIYKASCSSCHGADGSKSASGSTPIKGQKAEDLLKKLNGYADGSYGGAQKKIMENVVKKHADELKTLADYMGTL